MNAAQLAQAVLEGMSPREYLAGMADPAQTLRVGESISHGTLNPDDLAHAYLEAIQELAPAKFQKLLDEDENLVNYLDSGGPADDREWLDYLVNEELPPILDKLCPPLTYFGSHPGDGSDIGCWPLSEDDYANLAAQEEIIYIPDEDDTAMLGTYFQEAPAIQYAIVRDGDETKCVDRRGKIVWKY